MKRAFFVFLLAASTILPVSTFAEEAKPLTEIFVTSGCPYCIKLESFLKKSHIDYTRHDIEADEVAAETFYGLGGEGVPLIRIGKKVIHGYDPAKVLEALRK